MHPVENHTGRMDQSHIAYSSPLNSISKDVLLSFASSDLCICYCNSKDYLLISINSSKLNNVLLKLFIVNAIAIFPKEVDIYQSTT